MKLSVKEHNTITPAPVRPAEECSERYISLGKFLQNRREEKHLTVRQLAAKAKISYSELSKIENGKSVTPSTLRRLSPHLSIAYDILMSKAGYSFQTDTDSPIYLDLEGNKINLEKHALKLYTRNVDLFFHLDQWINDSSDDDIELLIQFLCILKRKKSIEQEQNETSKDKPVFFKIFNGLQALIQACLSI